MSKKDKKNSQNDSAGIKTPSSTRLHFYVLKDRKSNTRLVVFARSSNLLLEKSKTARFQVSTTNPCLKSFLQSSVWTKQVLWPGFSVQITASASLLSVVVELEVKVSALEGVEARGPFSASSTLLILRVQRVLAGIKFLTHFCTENNKEECIHFKTLNH